MQQKIMEFAKMRELKHADMLFVFVMSHGKMNKFRTVVDCCDGNEVECNWIEQQFDNKHCPSMQKKPKIIVYQICR